MVAAFQRLKILGFLLMILIQLLRMPPGQMRTVLFLISLIIAPAFGIEKLSSIPFSTLKLLKY
ncbi:conserved hypothetical protein [Ricinus communis]|uniref:Uncharacterized protein n=1 Tax=Ricinus communis TaxID=3988 RepID=B9SEU3_RICCO|nr:conserved hypothetical protein [Ricinus communis]